MLILVHSTHKSIIMQATTDYTLIAFDKRVTFWLQLVGSLPCACAYVALFARKLTYNHYTIAHACNAANAYAQGSDRAVEAKKLLSRWRQSEYRLVRFGTNLVCKSFVFVFLLVFFFFFFKKKMGHLPLITSNTVISNCKYAILSSHTHTLLDIIVLHTKTLLRLTRWKVDLWVYRITAWTWNVSLIALFSLE